MSKKKSPKKWIKFRHKVVTALAYIVLYPIAKFKYNIKIEKFGGDRKRAYLILLNHQTPFDQFFVGMTFKKAIYYLATEDLFSMGFVSDLIRWIVAPIPIRKQTTDITAVMNCIRVAKEGGSICIAPEGNRTYSGQTEYMNPSIAALAKKLNLPVAIYRIEGGYGAEPRWSDCVRKGRMRAFVSEIIEPDEMKAMTNEELFERIKNGLYVNEAVADCEFISSKRAEYLERAIYVCPDCGLAKWESSGNKFCCTKCGKEITYCESKMLKCENGEFPFNFVLDWYNYQKDFVNRLDIMAYKTEPMFADKANVSEVIVFKRKEKLFENAEILLFGDRIEIDGDKDKIIFPFESTNAVTVLGRNKCNIYFGGKVYQLKGDKRFNALKYVNIYNRCKNILKGEENEQFLGL